jgi:hypothetical protein
MLTYNSSSATNFPCLSPAENWHTTAINWTCRGEQSSSFCRQPASTVTPGIEPRWDPWPYICSMSTLLFFFPSLVVPPLIKREGLNWTCFWINFSYKHSSQTPQKTLSLLLMTSQRFIARSNKRKHVYRTMSRNRWHNPVVLLLLGADHIENIVPLLL